MAIQTIPEKLQLKDEKNILIQGLPSSIEKQFIKISFAKSVTPLLKIKKIEFALLFAVSKKQLSEILHDVMPALHPNVKLWIAYPKPTSKIASDLCRHAHWEIIDQFCLEAVVQIEVDNVWCATNFRKAEKAVEQKIPIRRANVKESVALAI
jgi:hypothetical protein